jgi:crotonobetaine/carnitine-CoA ligase
MTWSEVVSNKGDYRREEVLWSDPSCILYTSGTTGPSKGVMLPQNYTVFMGEIVWEAAEYTENDCLYNALPLFHGNAQQLSFMPALLSGARTVLAERFSASRFWDDVRRYGCTEFNSLGSIVPILYKADPKPDDADNPLRMMVTAATPRDIFQPFEKRFGLTLVEIYGMTEFGLPLMNHLKDRKPGSCGKPRRCAVRLLDDNEMEVGPNTVGELLVRPDKDYCMLLEYYNMPDKTVEAWRNLWFHSGDYFRYDEDGYYYFVDRKKDALRRRGENISSYEVEKSINGHPAVLESAAVAVKSPMGEDEVMVCLVLRPGFSLKPEELMAHCEERMAYFMIPRYIRIMEGLPKTATERVQKHVLRSAGVTPDTWDREAAGYELKR